MNNTQNIELTKIPIKFKQTQLIKHAFSKIEQFLEKRETLARGKSKEI